MATTSASTDAVTTWAYQYTLACMKLNNAENAATSSSTPSQGIATAKANFATTMPGNRSITRPGTRCREAGRPFARIKYIFIYNKEQSSPTGPRRPPVRHRRPPGAILPQRG